MSHLPDEVLQALADGAADAAAAEHLASCAACQAEVAEYRALFAGLEKLDAPAPPPRFTAQVMARVAERDVQLARQRRLAVATLALSALASFCCFALAGNGVWARQISAFGANALAFAKLGHLLGEAIVPIFAALRLPLAVAAALLCVPILLALHRTSAPRSQPA